MPYKQKQCCYLSYQRGPVDIDHAIYLVLFSLLIYWRQKERLIDLQMEKAEFDSLIINYSKESRQQIKRAGTISYYFQFACLKDRNSILDRVHQVNQANGKTVRTKIPGPMKKYRAQLVQKAHQQHKEDSNPSYWKKKSVGLFKSDVQQRTDGPVRYVTVYPNIVICIWKTQKYVDYHNCNYDCHPPQCSVFSSLYCSAQCWKNCFLIWLTVSAR